MEKAKKKNSKQWDRVKGLNLHPDNEEKANKNQSIMKNKIFIKSCENAKLEPTKRQASKWNNKKGLAYKNKMKMV